MTQPHDSPPTSTTGQPANTVEMPRPTAWPIVLSLGIVLVALGVATNLFFCAVGGLLLLIGLIGWMDSGSH